MIDAVPNINPAPPNVRADLPVATKPNNAASTQTFEELFNMVKDIQPVKEDKTSESSSIINRKAFDYKKRTEDKAQTQFDRPDSLSVANLASSQTQIKPEPSTAETQNKKDENNPDSKDANGSVNNSTAGSQNTADKTSSQGSSKTSQTNAADQNGKTYTAQAATTQSQTPSENSAAATKTDQPTIVQAVGQQIAQTEPPVTADSINQDVAVISNHPASVKDAKASSPQTTATNAANLSNPLMGSMNPAVANQADKTVQPVNSTDPNPTNTNPTNNAQAAANQPAVSVNAAAHINSVAVAQPIVEALKTATSTQETDNNQKRVVTQVTAAAAPGSTTPTETGQVKPLFTSTNTISEPARLAEAHTAEIINQITKQVEALNQQGHSSIRMQLNPQELGRIDLRVSNTSQGLNIVLNADQASTNQMLKGQLDQLRQSLSDAGIQLANLNVGQQSSQSQSQGSPTPKTPFVPTNQAPAKESPSENNRHITLSDPGQSIDYRI